MATRYDEAHAIEPVELPSGAMRIDARTTRAGVLVYVDASGRRRREYRPPEEVFADASLATMRGVAVTDLHPDDMVRPENWRALSKGHVGDDVRPEPPFVGASIVVHDADEIAKIRSRERVEVSMGYEADVEETAGTTPDGEEYDAIQRNIRYNHAALGPQGWGRAGPLVRLRVDCASAMVDAATDSGIHGAPTMSTPITPLRKVRIDTVDLEVPEPVALELDQLRSRCDAAEKRVAIAEAKSAPEVIRARVAERVRLLDAARARKVRADADMADDEIIASIVSKAFPGLDLAGKSHEVLMELLVAAMSLTGEAPAPAPEPVEDTSEEEVEDPSAAPKPPPPARMDAAAAGRPGVGAGATTTPSLLEQAKQRAYERSINAYRRKAS